VKTACSPRRLRNEHNNCVISLNKWSIWAVPSRSTLPGRSMVQCSNWIPTASQCSRLCVWCG